MFRACCVLVVIVVCCMQSVLADVCNTADLSKVDTADSNGYITRTITVGAATSVDFTECCPGCLTGLANSAGDVTHLVVQKDASVPSGTEIVWTDFMFNYGTHGDGAGTTLTIKGLTLKTSSIDAYAIYSKYTRKCTRCPAT